MEPGVCHLQEVDSAFSGRSRGIHGNHQSLETILRTYFLSDLSMHIYTLLGNPRASCCPVGTCMPASPQVPLVPWAQIPDVRQDGSAGPHSTFPFWSSSVRSPHQWGSIIKIIFIVQSYMDQFLIHETCPLNSQHSLVSDPGNNFLTVDLDRDICCFARNLCVLSTKMHIHGLCRPW